jgi:hypothetical protein
MLGEGRTLVRWLQELTIVVDTHLKQSGSLSQDWERAGVRAYDG